MGFGIFLCSLRLGHERLCEIRVLFGNLLKRISKLHNQVGPLGANHRQLASRRKHHFARDLAVNGEVEKRLACYNDLGWVAGELHFLTHGLTLCWCRFGSLRLGWRHGLLLSDIGGIRSLSDPPKFF